MSPQTGHVVGSEQTFELQREQLYPPSVGREWHAQNVGEMSVILDGNPIINKVGTTAASPDSLSFPVELLKDWVGGGVVARMKRSRKWPSSRQTV